MAIVVVLILTPEPTTKVMAVCMVAGVLLGGTDMYLDILSDAKREKTRGLLESIDRDGRIYAARRQLLRELKKLKTRTGVARGHAL